MSMRWAIQTAKLEMSKYRVFTQPLPNYNEALVQEFYTSYTACLSKKKKGQKKGLLEIVMVRGVNVLCGPNEINAYYGDMLHEGTHEYAHKIQANMDTKRP
ncbi:hypothetical protein HAX54_006624 [Datura stramonium]|uniref:Uncharacterized protein n=1 Tax=Datura stramonium TaxID=4076 RepID=A0ABS8TBW0_DATST|nr:hypothetical protein [Datura stramonium]